MSSKIYKIIYSIFNLLSLLLIIYAIFSGNKAFIIFTSDTSMGSSFILSDFIALLLIGVCIYFIAISLLNIITRKQHSTKLKTTIFRVLSIITLLIPLIIVGINIINEILNGNGSSYYYTWMLALIAIVTGIIMVVSLHYLFQTKKKKFDLKDILPIVISLIFITLLLTIYNINGEFVRLGTNNNSLNFKPSTIIYYVGFVLIPVQLVNLYNLFNLKFKK